MSLNENGPSLSICPQEQKPTSAVTKQANPTTLAPHPGPPSISPALQPPLSLHALEALQASIATLNQEIAALLAELKSRPKELERRLEARRQQRTRDLEEEARRQLIANQGAIAQFAFWAWAEAIRAERPFEYLVARYTDRERRREQQRQIEDRPNFLLWLLWLILAYALFQI